MREAAKQDKNGSDIEIIDLLKDKEKIEEIIEKKKELDEYLSRTKNKYLERLEKKKQI